MGRMVLVGAVLFLGACGVAHGPDPVSAAAGPSVGAVRTADRVVRFVQGDDGIRYWVEDAQGVLLEADLSLEGLAAYDPALARLMDESVARTGRSLDASTFGLDAGERAKPGF